MSSLFALFLGAALLGCGGGGDSMEEPTPTPTPSPTPPTGGGGNLSGRIVYWKSVSASAGVDLYSASADGSGEARLTSEAGIDEYDADVSPDGNRVVYLSQPKTSSARSIRILNADGTGQATLTADDIFVAGPRFSPDGTKIVFQARLSATSSFTGIFVVNADGSGLTKISTNNREDYEDPDFSPDGTKITFIMDDEIYTMNADGSGEKKLTDGGMFSYLNPKFSSRYSPDGTKLFYSSKDTNAALPSYNAYVINADGTGRVSLGKGIASGWSPDSTRILLVRSGSSTVVGSTTKLIFVNLDGTGETELPLAASGASW